MSWTCGIDVGTSNLAISFYDPETRTVKQLHRINLHVRGSEKLDLGATSYGRRVHDWVSELSEDFRRTGKVGIEIQPPRVGRKEMHLVQAHLESCIRGMYPHVEVILTDPKRVRRFYDIAGGAYKERKDKSVWSGIVAEADLQRMRRLFLKPVYSKAKRTYTYSPKIDDVVEASIIALYVAQNAATLQNPIIKVSGPNAAHEPCMYSMSNVPLHPPEGLVGGHAEEEEEEGTTRRKRKRPSDGGGERKKRTRKTSSSSQTRG